MHEPEQGNASTPRKIQLKRGQPSVSFARLPLSNPTFWYSSGSDRRATRSPAGDNGTHVVQQFSVEQIWDSTS